MHVSPLVVVGLQFVDGDEFRAWLMQQSPPCEVLEIVERLSAMRARALSEVVTPAVLVPLLESLLSHSWLDERWMPEAVHVELAEAHDLALYYFSPSTDADE
jgi:hypothetical protein